MKSIKWHGTHYRNPGNKGIFSFHFLSLSKKINLKAIFSCKWHAGCFRTDPKLEGSMKLNSPLRKISADKNRTFAQNWDSRTEHGCLKSDLHLKPNIQKYICSRGLKYSVALALVITATVKEINIRPWLSLRKVTHTLTLLFLKPYKGHCGCVLQFRHPKNYSQLTCQRLSKCCCVGTKQLFHTVKFYRSPPFATVF